MRRVAAMMMSAAVVLLTVGVFAQAKTNFTGKWTPDADKNAAARAAMTPPGGAAGGAARAGGGAGGAGGGAGRTGGGGMQMSPDINITQTEKTLTVSRMMGDTKVDTVYNLDGTETTNGQNNAKSKAKWDGAKLVISTTTEGANGAQTRVVTWSIEADGGLLQETAPRQEGGMSQKSYFKKAS